MLGDVLHHLHLPLRVQLVNHGRRLLRVHIGQHQGDGLGPLMLQGGIQGLLICLVQEGELPVFQGLGHLVQQHACRLLPKASLQHGPGILQSALGDSLVGHAHLVVLVEYILGGGRVHIAQPGDLQGELLHVLRVHVLIELGGLLRSQRDDHRGRLLLAGQFFSWLG